MGRSTRREFLKDAALAGVAVSGYSMMEGSMFGAAAQAPQPATTPSAVSLKWLGEKPPNFATGVSFGVPWPQSAVKAGSEFRVSGVGGSELALQSWPMAYWPDGSLKWSGFATVVPAGLNEPVSLSVGQGSGATGTVSVRNSGGAMQVDTGALRCSIALTGTNLFTSMELGGKQIAGAGRLVCILQNGPATNPEDAPARESYASEVKHVTVEQQGPVRAVVRVDGVHRGVKSGREWLPFTVRMYFYSGQSSVRLVHTIVFDGDQEKDFVRGLGLEFDVPLRDQAQNRTVRFAGQDGGMWSEPLQPGGGSIAQESGQEFDPNPVFKKNAVWNDFRLTQANADGFTIVKRTGPTVGWLFSDGGKRAAGLASIGDLPRVWTGFDGEREEPS